MAFFGKGSIARFGLFSALLAAPGAFAYLLLPQSAEARFRSIETALRRSQPVIAGFQTTSVAGLYAETLVVDLGRVPIRSPASSSVTLHNFGDRQLTLDEVRSECGCTVAVPSQRDVSPGESLRIAVHFDASKLPPGEFERTVRLLIKGAALGEELRIAVKGRVDPTDIFTIFPSVLDFGDITGGAGLERDVHIRASDDVLAQIPDEIRVSGQKLQEIQVVNGGPSEAASSVDVKRVRLLFEPSRDEVRIKGVFDQKIIQVISNGSNKTYATLSVRYRIPAALISIPAEVYTAWQFGRRNPACEVILRSRSGRAITIRRISSDLPIEQQVTSTRNEARIRIVAKQGAVLRGITTGSLRVWTEHDDRPVEIPVTFLFTRELGTPHSTGV